MSEFGINVIPVPLAEKDKQNAIKNGDYQAVLQSYDYFDMFLFEAIRNFYFTVLKGNGKVANFENKIIENLLSSRNLNEETQKKIIQRIQIILHQETPIIPLYFDNTILYAVHSRFNNIRISYQQGGFYYFRLNPYENWFVPKY